MALIDVFSYHTVWMDEKPSAPWRHGPWLWATQGHLVVALHDEDGESIPTPERMNKGVQYLELTPLISTPVLLSALRSFAGPVPPAHQKCSRCMGSGRNSEYGETVECEHCGGITRTECPQCGGEGEDDSLPTNEARIAGVQLNLSLLAFALSQVPTVETTVTIGELKTDKMRDGSALVVLGPGWRIVLMGTRDHGRTLPSFRNERSGQPEAVAAVVPGFGDSNS